MATKPVVETPNQKLARLAKEIEAAKAELKATKTNAHAKEKAATAALVKWMDTTAAGKKFAAAHYQTQAKARFALTKDGYIGEWAFTLARAEGYK